MTSWTSRSGSFPLHRPYRRAARLVDRGHDQHGRRQRRLDHGGAVPRGVRRRPPVGAHRHRRHGAAAGAPDLAQQGRDRVRRRSCSSSSRTGSGRRPRSRGEREHRRRDPGSRRERGAQTGSSDAIERIGNKIPHPAIIFLGLIVIVIVAVADPRPGPGSRVTTEVAEPSGTEVVRRSTAGGYHEPVASTTSPGPAVPDYEVATETIRPRAC